MPTKESRRVLHDDPGAGVRTLSPVELEPTDEIPFAYEITVGTALGRGTTYRVEDLATGARRASTTGPGGEVTLVETRPDGTEVVTYPDGTLVSRLLGPDPLWGMLAPVATSSTVTTPSGLASTVTRSRAMEPEDAASLAEVESVTDSVTVNGRTSTATWNATSRTFATMSAALRASLAEVDGQGRLTFAQDGGFAPLALSYDPRGRLEMARLGRPSWEERCGLEEVETCPPWIASRARGSHATAGGAASATTRSVISAARPARPGDDPGTEPGPRPPRATSGWAASSRAQWSLV